MNKRVATALAVGSIILLAGCGAAKVSHHNTSSPPPAAAPAATVTPPTSSSIGNACMAFLAWGHPFGVRLMNDISTTFGNIGSAANQQNVTMIDIYAAELQGYAESGLADPSPLNTSLFNHTMRATITAAEQIEAGDYTALNPGYDALLNRLANRIKNSGC